jgi:hypothetical protein
MPQMPSVKLRAVPGSVLRSWIRSRWCMASATAYTAAMPSRWFPCSAATTTASRTRPMRRRRIRRRGGRGLSSKDARPMPRSTLRRLRPRNGGCLARCGVAGSSPFVRWRQSGRMRPCLVVPNTSGRVRGSNTIAPHNSPGIGRPRAPSPSRVPGWPPAARRGMGEASAASITMASVMGNRACIPRKSPLA